MKTVNLLAQGDVGPVVLFLCGPRAVHLLVGRLLRRLLSLLRLPLLLRVCKTSNIIIFLYFIRKTDFLLTRGKEVQASVMDPHHFHADPDADPDSTITLMRIRILIFI
jgi:hypothetical protein